MPISLVARLPQPAIEAQRAVGEAGVLHVDADEDVVPLGGREHPREHAVRESAGRSRSPSAESFTDTLASRPLGGDRVEHALVLRRRRLRLLRDADELAQDVDRRHGVLARSGAAPWRRHPRVSRRPCTGRRSGGRACAARAEATPRRRGRTGRSLELGRVAGEDVADERVDSAAGRGERRRQVGGVARPRDGRPSPATRRPRAPPGRAAGAPRERRRRRALPRARPRRRRSGRDTPASPPAGPPLRPRAPPGSGRTASAASRSAGQAGRIRSSVAAVANASSSWSAATAPDTSSARSASASIVDGIADERRDP